MKQLVCVSNFLGAVVLRHAHAGRAISGVGVGLGFAVDPMYIAEVSPAQHRGQLVSWSETATNVGILLGFIASYALKDVRGNMQWRFMIALGELLCMRLL